MQKNKHNPTTLYLVRHGEAVSEQADPLRPLTEKGRAQIEETAKGLKGQGAKVDEIWHSAKLRAKQTAEIIASILNVSEVIELEGLKPNDPVSPIAGLLRKSGKTILIACHLPFLSKLASFLKTGVESQDIGMEVEGWEEGGVVRVEI